MAKLSTFLTYETQAEEAAKLYTSIFKGSKITRTTRYPTGTPMPKGTVMSVEFELEGRPFVALNAGSGFKFTNAFSTSVSCETQSEIDDYTAKLLAGGGEQGQCGWLTDRFGVSWQVNPAFLNKTIGDQDDAKAERVMKAMMKMKKIDLAELKRAYEG